MNVDGTVDYESQNFQINWFIANIARGTTDPGIASITIPGSLEYKRVLVAVWDDVEWVLFSRS